MTKLTPRVSVLIGILIHTSVKLVTYKKREALPVTSYFNPHEREARDDTYYSRQ